MPEEADDKKRRPGKKAEPPKPQAPEGPEAAAEAALRAAKEAISELQQAATPAPADAASTAPPEPGQAAAALSQSAEPAPVELPAFDRADLPTEARGIDLLGDVSLNVKIELGRTRMLVEDVLRLSAGAVVELDKLAGDPVDVYVNDRPVARGEVLVLNDNFCVRINEILTDSLDEERSKAMARGSPQAG